ncbi:helix-turn-helix domain-containing protein [Moorella sp. E306M]|uniref:helix-turn-helix domain-containing protein n=1 Tax=Moorella sp. E306M TaxID=2572683 RepID=UPI0010FFC0BF|nr:helix-turn-helix domain-containing protein [Moorella sp. E306M]GEA17995.1 transcriptional regulator [Moorella sp. E306M]
MDLIRIGDRLISRRKINSILERIFTLRCQGFSQQEAARQVGVDRSFVSRLETLGEIRRGRRIAVVGFPVANKAELENMLRQEGVEYILLLTDAERWDFVRQKSGLELLNQLMEIVGRVRDYDVVIIIGSDYRIKVSEALLGREVVGVEIGPSPIQGDREVDVEGLRALVRQLGKNKGRDKK